jgi:hypothetical protein
MKAKFLLNDSQISYLIHGQPFKLGYEINKCLFVVIIYREGISSFRKFQFRKSSGVFENLTNSFDPSIKILAFGLGFKIFNFDLNINFINCKSPQLSIPTFINPSSCELHIRDKAPFFNLFKFSNNIFFKDIFVQPIHIKENQLSLSDSDDFKDFKEAYLLKTKI